MPLSPLEDVLAHWSKLIENFSTSSQDFYTAVDAALERRKLHEVQSRYIQWSEGGVLSPNREYFRVEGSGFALDICAAPFGTGFFFSWWLCKKRPQWVFLYVVAFAIATWFISKGVASVIAMLFAAARDPSMWILQGLLLNPFSVLAISLLFLLWFIVMAAHGGFRGSEEVILTIPILNWVYERWFAPVSFYKLDTAAMFRAATHAAVLEVIDDLTTQKGLRALAPEDRAPILRGLS